MPVSGSSTSGTCSRGAPMYSTGKPCQSALVVSTTVRSTGLLGVVTGGLLALRDERRPPRREQSCSRCSGPPAATRSRRERVPAEDDDPCTPGDDEETG